MRTTFPLSAFLPGQGLGVVTCNASAMFEPWQPEDSVTKPRLERLPSVELKRQSMSDLHSMLSSTATCKVQALKLDSFEGFLAAGLASMDAQTPCRAPWQEEQSSAGRALMRLCSLSCRRQAGKVESRLGLGHVAPGALKQGTRPCDTCALLMSLRDCSNSAAVRKMMASMPRGYVVHSQTEKATNPIVFDIGIRAAVLNRAPATAHEGECNDDNSLDIWIGAGNLAYSRPFCIFLLFSRVACSVSTGWGIFETFNWRAALSSKFKIAKCALQFSAGTETP